MKKVIHPEYHTVTVKCVTCGNEFETGSTSAQIRVDTCSKCHPFFTGKNRHHSADGRVDKFYKKWNKTTSENK